MFLHTVYNKFLTLACFCTLKHYRALTFETDKGSVEFV